MVATRFWWLQIHGERYRRAEESTSDTLAEWWKDLRTGLRVPDGWIPPHYRIVGDGSWPDWMASWVPLWSERAVDALGALVSNTCQIVRWVDEPGHNYWLVNVLTLIPRTQWTCEKSSVYSGTYASADGIRVLAESIPHIFRLEGYEGKTFVSDELAKLSVASKLKGAAFVHPLIHWAESVFMPRRFGRDGTGFVHLSPESRFRGMH
jgi:hypothetical protein